MKTSSILCWGIVLTAAAFGLVDSSWAGSCSVELNVRYYNPFNGKQKFKKFYSSNVEVENFEVQKIQYIYPELTEEKTGEKIRIELNYGPKQPGETWIGAKYLKDLKSIGDTGQFEVYDITNLVSASSYWSDFKLPLKTEMSNSFVLTPFSEKRGVNKFYILDTDFEMLCRI